MKSSSKKENARHLPRYIDPVEALELAKEAIAEGRVPSELAVVARAYKGDIDAIISIFREMQYFLAFNDEFNRLYMRWFEQMLDALERKKSISAITNIPIGKWDNDAVGSPKDILADDRNWIIFCLVYYRSLELGSEEKAVNEVYDFILDSGEDEYDGGFVGNLYYKYKSALKPRAEAQLDKYIKQNNCPQDYATDSLIDEYCDKWLDLLELKFYLEGQSRQRKS